MRRLSSALSLVLVVFVVGLWPQGELRAAKVSGISQTKHNLSASGPGTTKATSESQICVFCHTPHGAENAPGQPLWNRKLSSATYTTYSSSSIDANVAELQSGPGGASKLCLSCHDGTMALGNVNVLGGKVNQSIAMSGGITTMPTGAGAGTGFTRNLGTNLTNDHPISFTYDATLASKDGELRTPGAANVVVATRVRGTKSPALPLDAGKVQCTTCHDPHIRETDETANGVGKFLRLNRLQTNAGPSGGAFNVTNDQICVACHDKDGLGWANSTHANPAVANETYKTAAAAQREFPNNLPVWRAGCLNCHDTHTVEGSRRLLREGTDSTSSPKTAGGRPAIEETCYQCHQAGATRILNVSTPDEVPDIKTDFGLAYRMPITSNDQNTGGEVHDIGTSGVGQNSTKKGADFVEAPVLLGKGNLNNRHVECTDCHNPHRVIKNRRFNDNPATPANAGTHLHAAGHTNIASGVLKGTTGAEPETWSSAAFFTGTVTSWRYLSGNPAVGASIDKKAATTTWVTREYQVCLKCHSNYAYDTPPALQSGKGTTPPNTNNLVNYTDQSMEFQAPTNHAGHPTGAITDSGSAITTNNGRSWHPVIEPTGRTQALRGTTPSNGWRAPWNGASLGTQTMYCSDCHGSSVTSTTDVLPDGNTGVDSPAGEAGNPWGPHGSSNPFILKGTWASNGNTSSGTTLCLKCHNPTGSSNFQDNSTGKGNLHAYHITRIGRIRCHWCHTAVPHGWKNRSLLVNLNDVGPEAGLAVGTNVTAANNVGYTKAPYYMNAFLRIRTMPPRTGGWADTNCGPPTGTAGKDWMKPFCGSAP